MGNRYKKQAANRLAIDAPAEASGTAPAIDQGMRGAITTAEFSRSIANFSFSVSISMQS